MKALAVLASLVTSSMAINLARRENPAVLDMSIRRRPFTINPAQRDRLRRRQSTVQVALDNELTLYLANVTLGTPEQQLELHIDTGSSDLWVNTPSSSLCTQRNDPCSDEGTYTANSSSSYAYVDSEFNITYADGSGALGDYATDILHISNVAITDFQFGIGYYSSSSEGILGIGYPINEVAVQTVSDQPYPNLPVALKNAGMTNSVAYSLWLNDLESSTGSILFGGVDSAKYEDPLFTVPILMEHGYYAEFLIALTALGQNGNLGSISSNVAIPVLLDSGSSLTYLPDDIANAMFSAFDVTYENSIGAGLVDCGLAQASGTIDFSFSASDATISVNLSELVVPGGYYTNGEEYCIFGIAPGGDSTFVLGDTFLRSAYVVYDLDGNTISLAQTTFNSTSSDIQEIVDTSSTTGSIPGASVVPNAVSTLAADPTGFYGRVGTLSGSAPRQTAMPAVAVAAGVGMGMLLAL